MDPKSQHMSHNMYLLSVNEKHEVKREEDLGVIQPFWLASVGCDLTKNNPQEQYSPDNLPQN
jgi:branched-chain amino acid transport system substrate-binding protein